MSKRGVESGLDQGRADIMDGRLAFASGYAYACGRLGLKLPTISLAKHW